MEYQLNIIETDEEMEQYERWVRSHPSGSLWQSPEWKRYQEALGRSVDILCFADDHNDIKASALVVKDRTSLRLMSQEIPRGPVWEANLPPEHVSQFFGLMTARARSERCFALYLSPPNELPGDSGSKTSSRRQHPEATRIIDLTLSEEELLAQMKPKGRYNIRVAQKHSITVRESDEIDPFMELLSETSHRDRFTHLPQTHYETFLKILEGSNLLYAFEPQNKKPIAGLLSVFWNQRAIYYYGASSYAHRACMAPYLLQWENMRLAKSRGCLSYDLLGIAPPGSSDRHPWHGVSAFKEKFGGSVVTYPIEKQLILRPLTFHLLTLKRKMWR